MYVSINIYQWWIFLKNHLIIQIQEIIEKLRQDSILMTSLVFLDDPTMTMNLQLLLPPLNKIFLLFNSHNFRENNNLYIHYTTTLCDFYVYQNIKTYVTQCAIPCSTVSWFIKRRSNFQTFIYLSLNDSIYKLSFISHFELWKTDTVGMSNWPTISRNSKIIPDQ